MDIYKKRTAGRIAEIKIPEKGLPHLQEEGVIVEFARGSGVEDREAECGDHLVRASGALEPEQLAAIEGSSPEMRDGFPGASPARSEEGSVLGERREQPQSECTGDVNPAPGTQPQSRSGNTIRVVISKQQLAQLLAQGSIKKSSTCKALLPPSGCEGNCDMALVIKNAVTVARSPTSGSPWSPGLDTIVEAPLQLTRSPVITRNCKEIEHLLQTEM